MNALAQLFRNGILSFNLIKILIALVVEVLDKLINARLEIIIVFQVEEYFVDLLLVVVKLSIHHCFVRASVHFFLQILKPYQFRVLHENVLKIDVTDVLGKKRIELLEYLVHLPIELVVYLLL